MGTLTKILEMPYPEGAHKVEEELRLCGTNLAARQGQSQDREFRRPPI